MLLGTRKTKPDMVAKEPPKTTMPENVRASPGQTANGRGAYFGLALYLKHKPKISISPRRGDNSCIHSPLIFF